MSNNPLKSLYDRLNLKETDELVAIWQTNNRVEWADHTFLVIEAILKERLGELPPQNEPILECKEEEEEPQDDLGEAPEFYDPREVFWLDKWLRRVAIASIVVACIQGFLVLRQFQELAWSLFLGAVDKEWLAWLIAILFTLLLTAVQAAFSYYALRSLGLVLKTLMQMEFNSRGAAGRIGVQQDQ